MTAVSLYQVLEGRHSYRVSYGEPWPGLTADHVETCAHVQITMTVYDAINYIRHSDLRGVARKTRGKPLTDREYLIEFIIIHFADVIGADGHPVELAPGSFV